MTYKTILVHLDASRRCGANAELAARLAKAHGGLLVGLVPTGLYDGVIPGGDVGRGADFIVESADFLRRRAERISREFRERIGDGVPSEVRVVDAMTTEALTEHGRAADLIVLGQHDPEDPDNASGAGDITQRVLMEAGCPILVVPYAGRFDDVPRSAVLAWDGTREASVAIRAALPALRLANKVTVLSLGAAGADDEDRLMTPQLLNYLRRHDVHASAHREVTDIGVGDALLSRLADLGADLLVMGGYGHSRIRELVLGGATRRILQSMTVPVLMAH
ncbi:universal stress protein [Variovorax dokdonensis]|uniref:Universal stress protein n=1 Tax=Variovorax dokdonensis TaxID=344883 RepID=A0ABT7NAU9_9BURK|nr:universal stress protein [Variovorax dokdonensis]MDM0045076.1 universal stress protein [Variovorax dokdonensis]